MLVDKTCSYLKNKGLSKDEVISLIIKNSIETINIQMKISKFKISNTKNLKILLEAENYEIKYI